MDRICFWYDGRHRNNGSPLFIRNACFDHNIDGSKTLKPELGLSAADHKIPFEDYKRWGNYDINIWPDFGEDGLPDEYVACPGKNKVYWASDTHLGMDYRLKKAKEFDYVFLTIPRHMEKFKEELGHDRVYFLPHAGEPTCYTKKDVVKRYDVCFIGHLPTDERIDLLDALFRETPDFYYGQKFFEEASQKYNESKIVFNHCIDSEANMRVFEATLSGSMLLTNWSEDVRSLGYEDGVHLVMYQNEQDMVNKVKYYLKNDSARERIAKAGYAHTLANHTYLHRVKQILEVVRKDMKNGKGRQAV